MRFGVSPLHSHRRSGSGTTAPMVPTGRCILKVLPSRKHTKVNWPDSSWLIQELATLTAFTSVVSFGGTVPVCHTCTLIMLRESLNVFSHLHSDGGNMFKLQIEKRSASPTFDQQFSETFWKENEGEQQEVNLAPDSLKDEIFRTIKVFQCYICKYRNVTGQSRRRRASVLGPKPKIGFWSRKQWFFCQRDIALRQLPRALACFSWKN